MAVGSFDSSITVAGNAMDRLQASDFHFIG